MFDDSRCVHSQYELSVAYDEQRQPPAAATRHTATCRECADFQRNLPRLDRLLAAGDVSGAPDVSGRLRPAVVHRQWWRVAAVVAVGMVLGAFMAGIGRLDVIHAQELDDLFHTTSPSVLGLDADLVIVERGWHPNVPERIYSGSLRYAAPEQLAILLTDVTAYPSAEWTPNDVELAFSDGGYLARASSPCPVEALPDCLKPPTITSIRGMRPFDPGLRKPLEIVGPAASFARWSGLDVVGTPTLEGRSTIQVETTVAGADLIGAITERGAWRELHPTDRVLMWLDAATMVPARIEVFAARSPERDLWEIRRGYDDNEREPIFIVALSNATTEPSVVDVELPPDARFGGFVDGPARIPLPELPAGFELHRSGQRSLHDGGQVDVMSWSDGRAWVVIEATADWTEARLFGISSPFAQEIDLGEGSIGYLDPTGDSIAIHTPELDVVVSGSVSEDALAGIARSLGLPGRSAPPDWEQASVVEADRLPPGTLIPRVEGWSILGATVGDRTTILMTGTGSRRVLVTSQPGDRLDPPTGPDVIAVEVRKTTGRFDAGRGTVEWVEGGRVIRMHSETLALEELTALAATMVAR